jgi:hypothetical protein
VRREPEAEIGPDFDDHGEVVDPPAAATPSEPPAPGQGDQDDAPDDEGEVDDSPEVPDAAPENAAPEADPPEGTATGQRGAP